MTSKMLLDHISLLLESYERVTGRTLLANQHTLTATERFSAIDEAPFAVVSHGTEIDPIFNYGNRAALSLFGMSFDEFTALPSRCSAEPPTQQERDSLLQAAREHGYVDNYRGVRIAKDGRRFWIENVTLWNVIDDEGNYRGQAATYNHWTPI